jgi:hypothetical protein
MFVKMMVPKVLNNGRGHDRGRVKVVAISAVAAVAIKIAVVAVWIINNIAQIIITSINIFFPLLWDV